MIIKTTNNKGFQLTNGVITFSIQFGSGNYCSNRNLPFDYKGNVESNDCEVAVWKNDNNEWVTERYFDGDGDVAGHVDITDAIVTAVNALNQDPRTSGSPDAKLIKANEK